MLAEYWARHWPALTLALLGGAALLPWAASAALRAVHPSAQAVAMQAQPSGQPEWPHEWEGRALRPLALSAVEQRFAARFPGALARFHDGERDFVLRRVDAPTRMLHPAADCFRGVGYAVRATRLENDARGRLWRCFDAVGRDGGRLRVCERIEGADGSAFVDASAWFWAASLGRSAGPWLAVTRVQAL